MRLKDRVALVTGMAMGIGKGIAELFAEEGAAIIGLDIEEKLGAETAEGIRVRGGKCLFQGCDVSAEDQVQAAIAAGLRRFGRIDVLANVVGIATEAPVDLLEYAEWDRIIRINLTSMYLTAKHVMPCMLWLKRGSIIHISSLQAFLGFKGYPAYAASKAGIIGLTRQMAAEYAPQGIRVNCIAPGNVDTPQSNKVLERSPEPEKVLALWKKMHPLGRRGKPRDIAYAALYLACEESEWVTGQCLVVDGGLSISAPS